MLGHMGHEEIDKSIEKVIWSFKYPIHDSEKFDVPCESMIDKNSPKLSNIKSPSVCLLSFFSDLATGTKRN